MPNRTPLVRAALFAALAVTTACASASGSSRPSRDANLLTIEEVESRGAAGGTLYDAIQRLRPAYLRFHGTATSAGPAAEAGHVHVSVDGGALVLADALRSLPARQLYEARYLSASDAAQRFGTSASGGPVILVRQK